MSQKEHLNITRLIVDGAQQTLFYIFIYLFFEFIIMEIDGGRVECIDNGCQYMKTTI